MRKRMSILALFAALALTGCVHTRTVRPGDQSDPPFVGINQLGARKTATVLLADGRAFKARNLQMARDSTSWFYAGTDQFDAIATAEIHEVRFVHRGRGALEGFMLGLVSGAATGALLGFAAGDDPPCEGWFCWSFSAEDKAALMGGFLGALGGLTGPIVGAGKGSKEVYRFAAPAPVPPVIAREVK